MIDELTPMIDILAFLCRHEMKEKDSRGALRDLVDMHEQLTVLYNMSANAAAGESHERQRAELMAQIKAAGSWSSALAQQTRKGG